MAGGYDISPSVPPEDGFGRLVWRIDRVVRLPENALNFLAAAAILFLMLLGVVQIVLRLRDLCFGPLGCVELLNMPVFGYIDMIELAMPLLAILGIAYCQRQGTHIRMDILIQHFRGRLLWTVETVVALLTFGLAVMLVWFSWNFFYDAYNIGDTTSDAQWDTWPSKLLVPLAFGLWAIRLAVQFLGALRLAIAPGLLPVGVVLSKDISEQAKAEIREALGADADDDGPPGGGAGGGPGGPGPRLSKGNG